MLFNYKLTMLFVALLAIPLAALGSDPVEVVNCDSLSCDGVVCADASSEACDGLGSSGRKKRVLGQWAHGRYCDFRYRTPTMIGDYFGGSSTSFRGDSVLDRLFVLADDLDSPNVLPPGGSVLTITEPGPVGIFSSSIGSIQQLQSLLRAGSPIPGAVLQGQVADNATLTTLNTISQIQTQLGATALAYDIIALQAPPGSYNAAVNSVFLTRNAVPGATVYNGVSSGALIQGGVDTLNGGEDLDAFYFYDYIVRFNTALADASSGGVGRLKIAERWHRAPNQPRVLSVQ